MAEEADGPSIGAVPENEAEPPLRNGALRFACDAEGREKLAAFVENDDLRGALLAWFGADAVGPGKAPLRTLIDRDVAEIDEHISRVLDAIMNHESLKHVEGLWRGVRWLVEPLPRRGSQSKVVVKVLNASKADLARDLSKSPEFDQSQTFQKIYNEEFGIAGGRPYGLLVTDYEISVRPTTPGVDDVSFIRDLSKVASAAFCPLIVSAPPTLFGVDTMRELSRRENIKATFEQAEFARLRGFQSSDDARFIGVCVGRMLARQPHRVDALKDLGFAYRPAMSDGCGSEVWSPGAFAVAHAVIRAFTQYAWPAAMRGAPDAESERQLSGGVVAPIKRPDFETDRPSVGTKLPIEAAFSENQESQLNALGFIALRTCPYTDYVAFYNVPSAHNLKTLSTSAANQNARISSMLNYLLCACRFAHYVKIIAREWIGSYKTAAECQKRLQKWISGYCIASENTGYAERARFPLRRAKITVDEVIGRPGEFGCNIQLEPHFQLDYIVSEFELSTVLDVGSQAA